jgi:hypothetical protein
MSFQFAASMSVCLVADEDVQTSSVEKGAFLGTLTGKPELAVKFFRLLASQLAGKIGEVFENVK